MSTKLIESFEDLTLAKALARKDKLGKPHCKVCYGKGYRNIQIPLPPFKSLIRGAVTNQVEFCEGKHCSNETYQAMMSDEPSSN